MIAGPVEATVFGNIAIQLMSKGTISDLKEARRVIANSEEPVVYDPENSVEWDKDYEFYKKEILKK